jgi:hypothetical protein
MQRLLGGSCSGECGPRPLKSDLPLALRRLAKALIPTPRQVFPITPFAQASPLPRSTRPGRGPVMWINVAHAHGSCNSRGKSPGRMCSHSPRAFSRLERDAALPVYGLLWNKTAK